MRFNNSFYKIDIAKSDTTLMSSSKFKGDYIYNPDGYKNGEIVAILKIKISNRALKKRLF